MIFVSGGFSAGLHRRSLPLAIPIDGSASAALTISVMKFGLRITSGLRKRIHSPWAWLRAWFCEAAKPPLDSFRTIRQVPLRLARIHFVLSVDALSTIMHSMDG